MVTSVIGKLFVKVYNEKYSTNYSVKDCFFEVFYPLFFDHPKYMMTAGNSPLENPKIKWDDMLKGKIMYESQERRQDRLKTMLSKIRDEGADASTAVGYYSKDIMATTSGQVTNMAIEIDEDTIFSSWIGHGLGLGVKGGLNILFFDSRILLDIFDGWKYYRQSLNENKLLKGNQINAWNTQWLVHRYSRQYQNKNEMAGFNPLLTENGIFKVSPISWTKLLFGISRQYADVQMMAYLYNIGQTNTTYGFLPFLLNEIRRPIDLYKKLFGLIMDYDSIEELYGTAFGLSEFCKRGVIGLQALEPKGVKDFIFTQRNQEKVKMPKPSQILEITYKTYQIWILAMLNNQELWDKSRTYAEVLHKFVYENDKKNSTKRKNLVDKVLSVCNKRNFISGLTDIMEESNNNAYIEMAQEINMMSVENVPYFLALIRFHFISLN